MSAQDDAQEIVVTVACGVCGQKAIVVGGSNAVSGRGVKMMVEAMRPAVSRDRCLRCGGDREVRP